MRSLPRASWMEWCELHNRRGVPRLELADEGGHRAVVTLDYAPFEDILELDLVDGRTVERRLFDHPSDIRFEGAGDRRLVIRTPDDTVTLTVIGVSEPTRAVEKPRSSP